MMLKLFSALTVISLAIAQPAFAHNLKPGLYEVDVRVELPNMIDAATTLQKRVCITREMIDSHDAFRVLMETPLAACERMPNCLDGDEVGFQIVCPGRSSGHASAKFRISEDRFTGVINMDMGGKNMTVIERQSGTRIGTCK